MSQAVETLQFTDFFPLLFLLCILILAGNAIASRTPDAHIYAARAGYAVFLGYAVVALMHFGSADPSLIAAVLIRALMLAGIAVGASCCTMPVFIVARNKQRELQRRAEQGHHDRQRQRRDEENERLKREAELRDAERRRIQGEADAKYRAEAEAQQRVEQERRQKEKTRVAQACSRCELLFSLYRADIESRFSRDMLDDFMKKYMHEGVPAETVERRADELCAIMERHREIVKGKAQPTTIADLAKWFTDQQQFIEQSPAPADMKENQLIMLSMRYEKLFEEIMRKAQP
jgi:hypothetical protein